jgi:hypothetical protein
MRRFSWRSARNVSNCGITAGSRYGRYSSHGSPAWQSDEMTM